MAAAALTVAPIVAWRALRERHASAARVGLGARLDALWPSARSTITRLSPLYVSPLEREPFGGSQGHLGGEHHQGAVVACARLQQPQLAHAECVERALEPQP
jgi:hypothetical protein